MNYLSMVRQILLTSFFTVPLVTLAEEITLPALDEIPLSSTVEEVSTGYVMDQAGVPLTGSGESLRTTIAPDSGELLKLIQRARTPSADASDTPNTVHPGRPVSNLMAPMSAPPQYSFTDCYPFALGSGNTFNLNSAQLTCNNTYSATPIKLDTVLLDQSVGTNYDLLVYFYNHDTDALEFMGGSNNSGNADEFFSVVMPAGNYILYALPQAGVAPIEFVIGALGWSNYDNQEANENISQATPVNGASSNYVIIGNADNPNDRDVFLYTAAPAQNTVHVRLNSGVHTLQVASGGVWVDIGVSGSITTLTLANPGDSIYLRVSPAVGTTVNPLINYELIMSNPSAALLNYSVVGDVQPGWFAGTEVNTDLTFNGTVVDALGNPVPYADDVILVLTSEDGVVAEVANVDASGNYSHTLSVPACSGGGFTELRWDYANSICWEVGYHNDPNHIYTFGIGTVGAEVRYHHICNANLRPSIPLSNCN